MIRRALCRALLLGIALEAQVPLHAQAGLPSGASRRTAEADRPCDDVPPPRNVAEMSYEGQSLSATQRPNKAGRASGAGRGEPQPGFPPVSPPLSAGTPIPLGIPPEIPWRSSRCVPQVSSFADSRLCCHPGFEPFAHYLNSESSPFTAKDNILAERNIRDLFNLADRRRQSGDLDR